MSACPPVASVNGGIDVNGGSVALSASAVSPMMDSDDGSVIDHQKVVSLNEEVKTLEHYSTSVVSVTPHRSNSHIIVSDVHVDRVSALRKKRIEQNAQMSVLFT